MRGLAIYGLVLTILGMISCTVFGLTEGTLGNWIGLILNIPILVFFIRYLTEKK